MRIQAPPDSQQWNASERIVNYLETNCRCAACGLSVSGVHEQRVKLHVVARTYFDGKKTKANKKRPTAMVFTCVRHFIVRCDMSLLCCPSEPANERVGTNECIGNTCAANEIRRNWGEGGGLAKEHVANYCVCIQMCIIWVRLFGCVWTNAIAFGCLFVLFVCFDVSVSCAKYWWPYNYSVPANTHTHTQTHIMAAIWIKIYRFLSMPKLHRAHRTKKQPKTTEPIIIQWEYIMTPKYGYLWRIFAEYLLEPINFALFWCLTRPKQELLKHTNLAH